MESSSPYTNGMKARILTPEMKSTSHESCLQFAYNMYGINIGTLNVYLVSLLLLLLFLLHSNTMLNVRLMLTRYKYIRKAQSILY